MTRAQEDFRLAIACLVAGALTLFSPCHPVPAGAQEQPWTDLEIALGKLCVNESSFRSANDCTAIVQARGHLPLARLRHMHPRALAPVRTDSRRWIAGLDASMEQPEGWPAQVPWERGQRAWEAMLRVVRETMQGRRSVCSERPHVWGGRNIDANRIQALRERGATEVCTGTANVFFRFGGGQ